MLNKDVSPTNKITVSDVLLAGSITVLVLSVLTLIIICIIDGSQKVWF